MVRHLANKKKQSQEAKYRRIWFAILHPSRDTTQLANGGHNGARRISAHIKNGKAVAVYSLTLGEMTRLAYAQYEVHAVEVLSEAGGGVVGTLEEEERHPAR
jgi:serine phosphatase RsbU (regulator of sigma subunit)